MLFLKSAIYYLQMQSQKNLLPTTENFDGESLVRSMTSASGVYRMFDANDGVLYIGKANNLKKRLSSYFLRPQLEPRIAAMVSQIARVEITVTRTESEALLLEAQLIKSIKPRYNILLRDDKSYPYIFLSENEYSPRLIFHRGARTAKGRYFGPYPSTLAVRESLNLLQKLFRLRSCEDSYFKNRSRPCLQYQIRRCSAPCVGMIAPADYEESVRHASLFLEGWSHVLIDELGKQMDKASAELEFERAAQIRDQIAALKQLQSLHYVQGASVDLDVLACALAPGIACISVLYFRNGMNLGSRTFFPKLPLDASCGEVLSTFIAQHYLDKAVPNELIISHALPDGVALSTMLSEQSGHNVLVKSKVRTERARFVELAQKNADAALATKLISKQTLHQRFEALRELLSLEVTPQRLECFDISHTMGEATVASCVVFGPAGPEKSQYRRFNITGLTPGDDYAAIRQALERRYKRIQSGEGALPDILFIDGGKGQVTQAREVLNELGIHNMLIVGIAKGEERRAGQETLILSDSGKTLWPGPDSSALHLIQSIRDEAHRFAITGHRQRRERARETSSLQAIPGVGARRRSALLKHFGGLTGVTEAGVEELSQVSGISRELAERIYAVFHGE